MVIICKLFLHLHNYNDLPLHVLYKKIGVLIFINFNIDAIIIHFVIYLIMYIY
jgi:hypothetical protein